MRWINTQSQPHDRSQTHPHKAQTTLPHNTSNTIQPTDQTKEPPPIKPILHQTHRSNKTYEQTPQQTHEGRRAQNEACSFMHFRVVS